MWSTRHRASTDFDFSAHSAAKSLLPKQYVLSLRSPPPLLLQSILNPCSSTQASALYEAIEAAEGVDESGLPHQAYTVPEGATVDPSVGGGQGQKLFDANQ